MKLQWLLFDLDNTLVDFANASKKSLWASFEQAGMACNEDIYHLYKKENAAVWEAFELKEIDALTLRTLRFERLFKAMDEQGLSPSEFSHNYLQGLIKYTEAYEGVHDLLDDLKSKYRLSIVTNGLREVQRPRLAKTGLTKYFESIVVSDEIGVAKPDADYFENVSQSVKNPASKAETMIIGDNLNSDILGGVNFGIKTCWLHHGKKNETDLKPDISIQQVLELKKHL